MVEAEEFKRGMRALVAGVTIITTARDGDRRGLTATSVCSLTVDPPTLVACVNRESSTHDAILENSYFAVNLLTVDHVELAKVFSQPAPSAEERFAMGNWIVLQTGAPILADSAAAFDCRVHETLTVSTHTIFVGSVVDIRVAHEVAPLAYGSAQWGRFQLGID